MDSEQAFHEAARIVLAGGVIAFRTDTFYGLGVDPLNVNAVRRVRALKAREEAKPILLLISSLAEVERFCSSKPPQFDSVVKRHWPGPLTIVVCARPEVPADVTAGTGTIGMRLPDDPELCSFIGRCGGALTATSANVAGQPPARTAQEVADYFPSGIDLILDCGEVTATEPSTVLDLSGAEPRVLREGAIKGMDCGI
jgi:L-threonylcarbamoyladenylate synthase